MVLTTQQQGDLARLREVRDKLNRVLEITGDPALLNSVPPGDVDAIADNVLRAMVAASNALVSLGDHSGVKTSDFGTNPQRRRA